jgi:hypothetical protein
MIESITANREVERDFPAFCPSALLTAAQIANTASHASITHRTLHRSALVLDRRQPLARLNIVCPNSLIMVTRIVPRPIAVITNELANIEETSPDVHAVDT